MDESIQKNLEKPKLDPAGRLLLKAADLLEKRGWVQHRMYDTFGRMCALGAIYSASSAFRRSGCEAANRLLRYLDAPSIPTWNDKRGQTQKQVIAKLRAAAFLK